MKVIVAEHFGMCLGVRDCHCAGGRSAVPIERAEELDDGTVDLWRSPEQALYTAIKIPALILFTCGGNAGLNGMLAQLLGSTLSFAFK